MPNGLIFARGAAMNATARRLWRLARQTRAGWWQGGWWWVAYKGLLELARHLQGQGQAAPVPVEEDYARWLITNAQPSGEERLQLRQALARLPKPPLISVVMATHETPREWLCRAIESVLAQSYAHWQLCIADDGSRQPEVTETLRAYAALDDRIRLELRAHNGGIAAALNSALALAEGELVLFLDHNDELAREALALFGLAAARHPAAQLFYADEDKLDAQGQRREPYFKPDWNYFLLLGQNYICHPLAMRRALLQELGGFRVGFDGAQDHDLLLRASERLTAAQIVHIPQVLYHWRMLPGSTAQAVSEKPAGWEGGRRAIREHLARRGIAAVVEAAPEASIYYRVRWPLPVALPKVSILIPTRDGGEMLAGCLRSLRTQTTYGNYEVIVIDNGSREADTLALLQAEEAAGRLRVLRIDEPFNFSRLNNRAVEAAQGEFIVLMNDDIEIITPGWLEEMLGPAQLPEVGCVGARLWYPDERMQHGGCIFALGIAGHAHRFLPRGEVGYHYRAVLQQEFAALTGACLLVRKSLFARIGGLDETLAVAFNDIDFCLRLGQKGYRHVWTPYAEMIHHESATRGQEDAPEKKQRFAREIALMQARWGLPHRRDPASNRNLSGDREDFSLAFPPPPWLPGEMLTDA